MRERAILVFKFLNGIMQAPEETTEDVSGGFAQGGWARPYWEEMMTQAGEEAMAVPYDLLLGRNTYDSFRHAHGDSPMNDANKYLVSTKQTQPLWHNTVVVRGDVPGANRRLKSKAGPLLQVHGSHCLIQALLAHDLINEFRLWTFPLFLGTGKRLVGDASVVSTLARVKTRTTQNGVVMSIYHRR